MSLAHFSWQVQQDNFRNMTSTQFQRGNGANWGDSMTGLNYETNEALGTDAPPLLNGGEYAPVRVPYINRKSVPRSYFHPLKPQFQYGNFDPAGTNYTGFPFVSEPLPNLGRNIPHSFLETNAVPSNHGASPVWNLSNCWVGYETQDELHLTTVFRKAPFT